VKEQEATEDQKTSWGSVVEKEKRSETSGCVSTGEIYSISCDFKVVNTVLGVFDIDAQDNQSEWAYSIYEWVNCWYLNKKVSTIPVRSYGINNILPYNHLAKALAKGTHIVLWLYMLSARRDKKDRKEFVNERVLYSLAEGDTVKNSAELPSDSEGLKAPDNFVSVRINQTNAERVCGTTTRRRTRRR